MPEAQRSSRQVPIRALVLSLGALTVPVVWALLFPQRAGEEVGLLLWLTALIPAYLFTYYRGWEGAALALAAGMALIASVQVFLLVAGFPAPDWRVLLVVVLVYLVVSLGFGFVRERLPRERVESPQVALTDPLTRLPNRHQARIFLDSGFASAQRGTPLSVVLLEVESFEDFLDRFGPSAGEDVLRTVADVVMDNSRQTDLTARWGDEEFLAVLPNSEPEGAVSFTRRVREALADSPGRWGRISLGAGVASYTGGMQAPEILLAAADRALHRAMDEGWDHTLVAGEETWTDPPRAEAAAPASPPGDGAEEPDGRTILVVEEDEEARSLLNRSLQHGGFAVLDARSGEDALDLLEGSGDPVDLVLTNIVMEGMSGFTLVDRIQDRQGRVGALYTSESAHGDASWIGVPGAPAGFVRKPVIPEELKGRVREMLDAAGGAPSSSPSTVF